MLLKNRMLALLGLWCAIERRFPGATGIHVARVRFIFDYMDQSVVQRRSGMPLAEKMIGFQERKGEPFVFGLPAQEVEQFIKSRGFSQVRNISHDWLKRTYFKGRNQNRRLCPFWGIVDATL